MKRCVHALVVIALAVLWVRPPWICVTQRQGLKEKAEPIGHHWISGSDLPSLGSSYVAQGYAIHWGALVLESVALLAGGWLLTRLFAPSRVTSSERARSLIRGGAISDRSLQVSDERERLTAEPEEANRDAVKPQTSSVKERRSGPFKARETEPQTGKARVPRSLVLLGVLSILFGYLRGDWLAQCMVWAAPLLIGLSIWALLRLARIYRQPFSRHFFRPVLIIQTLFLLGAVLGLLEERGWVAVADDGCPAEQSVVDTNSSLDGPPKPRLARLPVTREELRAGTRIAAKVKDQALYERQTDELVLLLEGSGLHKPTLSERFWTASGGSVLFGY